MDTIGDMLTRIKNAGVRHHEKVTMPYSSMKLNIANVLKKEGYIEDFHEVKENGKADLVLALAYENQESPKVSFVKRVSKPGRRVYVGWEEIPTVLNGMGLAIVSTSKGIMSGRQARKEKVGGELICELY